jgi:hypothetical protein
MAFFYVKVHNPSPVQIVGDESSQQQTPIDEEFVCVYDHRSKRFFALLTLMLQLYRRRFRHHRRFSCKDKSRL